MRRPNLFILGAPRCGTTAMFEFLGAHPDIHPSRVKEPYYFFPGNKRSVDEYLALFSEAREERWLLEATPQYLSQPEAPEMIREFSPDARAIVMVRDPVEIVHSLHDLLSRLEDEPDDLRTALGRANVDGVYWRNARCGAQLEHVFDVFGREDVHVVVYDDFAADNAREYRRALEFLDVDPGFVPPFRTVNPSAAARLRFVQRTLRRDESVLRGVARRALPRSLRPAVWRSVSRLNRRPRPRPPIEGDLAETIWREFEPDVELLGALLDRDLVTLWRRG